MQTEELLGNPKFIKKIPRIHGEDQKIQILAWKRNTTSKKETLQLKRKGEKTKTGNVA